MRALRFRRGRQFVLLVAVLAAGHWSGCSSYSGPSEYEQRKTGKEQFISMIADLGGHAEEKQYQQTGVDRKAWVIDLHGATINEEVVQALLERVKSEYIAELNLSGSTLTDDQLVQLDAGQIGISLVRLDLGNTGITDRGLDEVNGMTLMMELKLSGSGVTRAAADRFKERMMQKRQAEMNANAQKMLGEVKIEL
jgi:hypothetical protein